jgi:hypothetical protein
VSRRFASGDAFSKSKNPLDKADGPGDDLFAKSGDKRGNGRCGRSRNRAQAANMFLREDLP